MEAAVIFDNQAIPNTAGTSDLTSKTPGTIVRADDFVLAPGTSTVTGVSWTGQYAPLNMVAATDDFAISFFENLPPQESHPVDFPQNASLAIATFVVANPNRTGSGTGPFQHSASFAPLTLLPNTRYWVSIFNDTTNNLGTIDWRWGMQTTGTVSTDFIAVRGATADSWGSEQFREMDFQILGVAAVPESSAFLFGGLISTAAAICYWLRRKLLACY